MYTIDRAFQDFMIENERKNLSPESMRYYRENITRFIAWLSENRIYKVRKITDKIVDDYFLFLLRAVPNRTSVNTYMRAVRRFLNHLSEQRIIKPIKVAPLKEPFKIKTTFDLNETELILNAVQPNNDTSVIMLLLLSCGLRSRSVRELRVGDVHVNDCYIDIRHTKNGKSLCLPISSEVAIVLKQYIAIYGRHDLLFLSERGCIFNRDSLRKKLNRQLHALGIPKNKSGVHIFRHTFGKIMSMNACPTAILQRWFGHSDIRMTQRYIDLYGNELKNTMSMLPTSSFQYA